MGEWQAEDAEAVMACPTAWASRVAIPVQDQHALGSTDDRVPVEFGGERKGAFGTATASGQRPDDDVEQKQQQSQPAADAAGSGHRKGPLVGL